MTSGAPKAAARAPHRPFPIWLTYAFVAALLWGIWGVLAKGPSRQLSGWMTQVLFTVALIPSAILAARSGKLRDGSNRRRGLAWGFASGLFAGVGDLCFYLALQSGADTAIAIPLISLYPLVTLTIAFFCFKERFSWLQGIGITVAVAAILLLGSGGESFDQIFASLRHLSLRPWIFYTAAAWICAGVFTAMQKLSTNHISAELSFLAWCSAFVVIAAGIVMTQPLKWHMPIGLVSAALGAGMLNGFGVIAAFAAYRYEGKAAIVAPLTATVQPLVTVVLALLFLGEQVGKIQALGIALAIVAALLLTQERKRDAQPGLVKPPDLN